MTGGEIEGVFYDVYIDTGGGQWLNVDAYVPMDPNRPIVYISYDMVQMSETISAIKN